VGSGTFDGYLCIERKIRLPSQSSDEEAPKAALYIVGIMGIEELYI
jgi:hypothetical protein